MAKGAYARLYRPQTSDAFVGDAALFLVGLVLVVPEAKAELDKLSKLFYENSVDDLTIRLRKALAEDNHTADIDELPDFHAPTDRAMASFNKRWLNNSENGLKALQLLIGHEITVNAGLQHDLGLLKHPSMWPLILGNEQRDRSKEGRQAQQVASRLRKILAKANCKNESGEKALEHAKLAAKVLHVYNHKLGEATLTERGKLDNLWCPPDANNLSRVVAPFLNAIETPLRRGPKPFEGESPIKLPEKIRVSPTTAKDWHARRK